MSDRPHLLLINPWIHDFAAYDVWARPLGLLYLAAMLRRLGCRISYIDCLDRFHPRMPKSSLSSRSGRGPYRKTRIPAPPGLRDIPRHYCRYGMDPDWFAEDLRRAGKPDAVLVTSLMTYWYPGVAETIRAIRNVWPGSPVILGGIYARLLPHHARQACDPDYLVTGDPAADLFPLIARLTGFPPDPENKAGGAYSGKPASPPGSHPDFRDFARWPDPALDCQHGVPFIPLLTTRGCPFQCAYCASKILEPQMHRRHWTLVLEELKRQHARHRTADIVFYDDALLVDPRRHILPLLDGVLRSGLSLRFHTPNALHLREITMETATLMKRAGFKTIRLGLETTAFDKRKALDAKVTEEEFRQAVACLHQAGFRREQLGAYLLAGLPNQRLESLESSIRMAREAGITPIPAWFTPIPGTPLWDAAVNASPFDLEADPVFTNNAVFPCRPRGFSWEVLTRVKHLAAGTVPVAN